MNESEYIAAKVLGLEIVALVLKLLIIAVWTFIGLWVLGVVIICWWAVLPIAAVVVRQASSATHQSR